MKLVGLHWAVGYIALPILIIFPLYWLSAQTTPDPLTAAQQSNRPLQALYQVEVLASQSGWTFDLARTAGDLWQDLGNTARAVDYWEAAIRLNSDDAPVQRKLAQGYLTLQRWSLAAVTLDKLVQLLPDDAWTHYQLGLLGVVSNAANAAEHLQIAARSALYQAISDDLLAITTTDTVNRAMQVGVVLADHTEWAAAERAFQYAADFQNLFPEALAYLGLARDNQGKNGRPQIEQAVTFAPQNAQVQYLYGLHLHLTGDDEASRDALERAAYLEPLNPAFAAELGLAYQRAGSFAQAEYWLQQAVTRSNGDARFQELLTQLYNQLPIFGN